MEIWQLWRPWEEAPCVQCLWHDLLRDRGNHFHNLRRGVDTILRALAMLVEQGSIRGTVRAMRVKKKTVSRWLRRVAEHSEEVSQHLMGDQGLTQVQVDEVWSFT